MNKIKFLFPMCITFLVIITFHYTKWDIVKLYPVIANFVMFCVFFGSTFMKETIVQKMAKMLEPNMKPKAYEYTRKLTYAWSLFMFFNLILSIITTTMREEIWAFYNGFLSYIFVGTFFIIEYMIRLKFKKKYGC